jgi:hypothetical protein
MPPLKISKNCYLGVAITDIKQIYDLVKEKKSIIYRHRIDSKIFRIIPASWAINLQARILQEDINYKTLYFCVKKEDFDLIAP